MEINGIPVYDFIIDEEITDEGVNIMSIVDEPAVEKLFVKLNSHEKQTEKLAINDEKRIITGVALRADFPIYRNDNGKEYYFMLSKSEILKIVQKFMREGRLKSVNLQHQYNTKDIYLFESFVLSDKLKLDYEEFKDVENGSWMVSYKVDNDEVWNKIKQGEFNGFSVEMTGELTDKQNESLNKQFTKNEANMIKKLLERMDKLTTALSRTIVKLNYITTDKGELYFDGDELLKGMQVYVLDENGAQVPAPEGEYTYDNKIYIVVGGIVEGVTSQEENKEERAEADVSDVPSETGEVVSVESFNELADVVRELVVEVQDLENYIEETETLKKQNASLETQVQKLTEKLEKATGSSVTPEKEPTIPNGVSSVQQPKGKATEEFELAMRG